MRTLIQRFRNNYTPFSKLGSRFIQSLIDFFRSWSYRTKSDSANRTGKFTIDFGSLYLFFNYWTRL